MKTKDLLRKLSKQFPKRYAKMNHDYVGLAVGKLPEEIHKVFLCLDCDWEIFPIIEKEKPDLVITHHPFIYGTKTRLFKKEPSKKVLFETLAELNIPVYSYHTNFDTGLGGMNDALANALGLQDIKIIENCIMMRGGRLKKSMPVEEFAKYAKNALGVDYGLLIACGKPVVESVAVIGGGGSGHWVEAKEAGYDIYISGDAPHHVRREIVNAKYNYLDVPHEVEKIFIPTMKKILEGFDNTLDIVTVDHEKMPKVIC